MKVILPLEYFYIVFLLSIISVNAQTSDYISVDNSFSTEDLVNNILIDDPCAIVTNIQSVTGTDYPITCGSNGIGYFQNDNPDFPIEEGVVLASGNATLAEGPTAEFPNDGHPRCAQWPGDSELDNYVADYFGVPDYEGVEATSITFDFIPLSYNVSFDYVFAGHDYGDHQCLSGLDVFAFFIENYETGEIRNLATVPDTDTPISLTTIKDCSFNDGNDCNDYDLSCSTNAEYFAALYGDCDFSVPGCPSLPELNNPISYRGRTVKMTAEGSVTPFTQYRVKLVVQKDAIAHDAAVFLEAGSFTTASDILGEDVTIANENALCEGETLQIDLTSLANAMGEDSTTNITWFYEGEEITNETGEELTVTESGTYSVKFSTSNFPDCILEDEIEVEFKKSPILSEEWNTEKIICDDFDTINLVATPTNIGELTNINYVWYKDGVELSHEGSGYPATEPGEYTVKVSEVDCEAIGTITITQSDFSVELPPETNLCDETTYEISPELINLNSQNPEIEYQWNTGENSPAIQVSESGEYTVEISYKGCTEEVSTQINFWELPVVNLREDFKICQNPRSPSTIEAQVENQQENFQYAWYRDGGLMDNETENNIRITEDGIYSVEVWQENATPECVGTDDVNVQYYDNTKCIIPEGISPNNDGQNDCFDLTFLNDDPGIINLTIYNRHGVEVYEKRNYTAQWCGQTSTTQETLPTGTYYYLLRLEDNTEKTGYVYLNY